jgi:Tellurite resistance protein TerB
LAEEDVKNPKLDDEETIMGLFDKVSQTRQHSEVTLAADGYINDSESQAISMTLSRMQLFRSYPNDVMRKMLDRLLIILQRQGVAVLFNAALATLPDELKETVFAVTTDIALADGEVSEEEEQLLNDLYAALGLSEEVALKIIDVMLIKNKG